MQKSLLVVALVGFVKSQIDFVDMIHDTNNITDYSIKGLASIQALSDFQFNLQYQVGKVNSAKDVMIQLSNIQSVLNYVASAGFAAASSELFDQSAVDGALNQISSNLIWVNAYQNKYLVSPDCSTTLNKVQGNVQTGIQKLSAFSNTKFSDPTKSAAAAQDLIAFCSNNVCDNSISILLSALNGDMEEFKCDLKSAIYKGDIKNNQFKGQRDMVVGKLSALINQLLIALTIQSANLQLSTFSSNAWIQVQYKYGF